MKQNQIKRQGDVALIKVKELPKGLTLRSNQKPESIIIARGENSNHCHAVIGEDLEVYEEGNRIYVNAKGEFELRHLLESEVMNGRAVWTNEHLPLSFPAGTYMFVGQTEYHPYEDEIRRVKD